MEDAFINDGAGWVENSGDSDGQFSGQNSNLSNHDPSCDVSGNALYAASGSALC